MHKTATDQRSPQRRKRDEHIAAQPHLPPLVLPPDAPAAPLEAYLDRNRPRPQAIAGVVENGVIRLLDPAAKLPERTRVIIVSAHAA